MSLGKHLTIDFSPMKKYRDFRLLWSAGFISNFGSQITYVALPFQIKLLTNSYLAVGAMGAVEIIPLIIFGLYGGVLADRVDRKKMIWVTELGAMAMTGILLGNSLLHKPHLLVLYFVAAGFACFDGLQRPSQNAILPRVVDHDDLPSANALMSIRWQFGVITGPALAGILIASAGVSAGFMVDIASFAISLSLLWRVRSVIPANRSEAATLASLVEGVKYAASRRDLMGTYVVDLSAMFFAMPNALFPFWADHLHARWALGMFYAAGTVGAILVTMTSGWMRSYPHHGRAVLLAAIGWGVAITLAGVTNSLAVTIFFLAMAGASDQYSALFRSAIWNQSIPDHLRGRLSGIELLSYSVGPLGGQLRAGTVAAWTNLRTSVISGGLLCIGMIGISASFFPEFRKYDVRTNKFAAEVLNLAEKSKKSES